MPKETINVKTCVEYEKFDRCGQQIVRGIGNVEE